jgi:hypothetical protein
LAHFRFMSMEILYFPKFNLTFGQNMTVLLKYSWIF